ncbi:MAG: carbohydrate ABC transporter permease, partial [Natronospirillum sp.]
MIHAQRFSPSSLIKNAIVLLLVTLWTLPTMGLLISSVRDADQLIVSGWWTALVASERNEVHRTPSAAGQIEIDGMYRITGEIFSQGSGRTVLTWGPGARTLDDNEPGDTVIQSNDTRMTVFEDGTYVWESDAPFAHTRGDRIFLRAAIPPRFTLENYGRVLDSEGVGRA